MTPKQLLKGFIPAMQRKLEANAHKGSSWRHDSFDDLFLRVAEELAELGEAIDSGDPAAIAAEAADVANFAAMIHNIATDPPKAVPAFPKKRKVK